jgi:hypothetical protein
MTTSTHHPTIQRPWSLLAAACTAAHHIFELSNGVGLVLQPELGLPGSSALWGAQIPAWALLAARGDKRWDRVLAFACGASVAGASVHFFIWPWQQNRLGLPVLTEAEGLKPSRLPAYNAILYAWGIASTVSILREIAPPKRRWALAGLATLPLLHKSARHHFSWVSAQAVANPAWWNRGVELNEKVRTPTIL